MNLTRKARKSVFTTLQDAFEDGTLMGTAYNVYDEEDLRSGVTPTRPFVYLLDFGATYEMRHLPAIVVQQITHKRPLGLGQLAYFNDLILHVFGRNRGERDDIASAIIETVDAIAVRDFNEEDAPVVQTMQLEPVGPEGDVWMETVIELPLRLLVEGTVTNWASLITGFWVTDATA